MIYKVKKTTHVFEEKRILNDDLMITFWTPKILKVKKKLHIA